MAKYSEQDLKYATELREDIHKEALAIVRKTNPSVTDVIDRHPVEDYFQESWEYPGKWYTVVAIPYGYKCREDFVKSIVRDTLASQKTQDTQIQSNSENEQLTSNEKLNVQFRDENSFYQLIDEYPNLALDYFIVKDESYSGYNSHFNALKKAFVNLCEDFTGDPSKAVGKRISLEEMFTSVEKSEKLSYRKAFLRPPYENGYTGKDFERVNASLFPNGTEELEIYEWTTDWSEYFDEGHEWWGTLCLTVYDKTLDRFAVIMASATD